MRPELEQVYRQHRQSLFTLALTILGCSGLAEDAVHEAFVRLCQKSDRPKESLVAYVFAAVRNAAVDFHRRRNNQQALMESLFHEKGKAFLLDGTAKAENHTKEDEQENELKSAIDQLDETSRQIVVMKIFSELTFDEIGHVLEMPPATAATRYRRAIMKLEEKLRKNS